MEKIKIGMFIDTYLPMIDGVTMVVENYAKRLNKIADVTVFCPKGKDKKYVDNFEYKVVRCKSLKVPHYDYTLPIPQFDCKFKKALKNSDLDIIHIHSPMGVAKLATKYAKKHNIPCVVTLHSQYKQDIKKIAHFNWLTNLVLKKLMKTINSCTEAWAMNEDNKRLFIEDYGINIPVKDIQNATDLQYLTNKDEIRAEIRKNYDIKDDEFIFVFIGRINLIKNLLFLVDSLKIMKQKGLKFKMLFVGAGQDEDKLKNHIKICGIEKDCVMCGRVSDRQELAKYYSAAHLFLFPSLYDTSSLTQIEAASQKTPTVFLQDAVTANQITDGVNGIVTKNDVEDFAQRIIDILSDENKYNELCENTYRDIYINWDMVTKTVYDKYIKLIENNLSKDKKDV